MTFKSMFSAVLMLKTCTAVIEGPTQTSDYKQYAVAVMSCQIFNNIPYCLTFCSGTLVAPDVVLTAGHCVFDELKSTFRTPVSPVALENMYVLVGATEANPSTSNDIIKVKSVENAGFARSSFAYSIDDDLGLIFLDSCVNGGNYAKIATPDSDPFPIGDQPLTSCTNVYAHGYGYNANIPDSIRVFDSKLRYTNEAVHSYNACITAAVQVQLALKGIDPAVLSNPLHFDLRDYLYSQFVPEKTICSGGNSSPSATCSGDSGGGWLIPLPGLGVQVVGLVSFGIGASSDTQKFCGFGPDYGTRVSFYASWIKEKMQGISKNCPGWTIGMSFASPSVYQVSTITYSSRMQSTRCPPFTHFQCYSGSCIEWSKVCDGICDCGRYDNSDEDSTNCSGSGPVVHSDAPSAVIVVQPQLPDIPIDLLSNITRESNETIPQANLHSSASDLADSLTCVLIVDYMKLRIAGEYIEGLNRGEFEPGTWTALCLKYNQCRLTDSQLNAFCDSWDKYTQNREFSLSNAQQFDATYGSSCAAPSVPASIPLAAFVMPDGPVTTIDTNSTNATIVIETPTVAIPTLPDTTTADNTTETAKASAARSYQVLVYILAILSIP